MTNPTKELFATQLRQARELCPGMPETVYHHAEYVADHLFGRRNDEFTPQLAMMTLFCVHDDLTKKQCGFAESSDELPEYLYEHNAQALSQEGYILQVFDIALAEYPDFVAEIRQQCADTLDWHTPVAIQTKPEPLPDQYPPYVQVAVDWWVNAVQHPTMDNGDPNLSLFVSLLGGASAFATDLDEQKLQTFRQVLADGIMEEFAKWGGTSTCILSVDYGPCYLLARAGEAAGIGEFGFPLKTSMNVSSRKVVVSAGYAAPYETLWTSEPESTTA